MSPHPEGPPGPQLTTLNPLARRNLLAAAQLVGAPNSDSALTAETRMGMARCAVRVAERSARQSKKVGMARCAVRVAEHRVRRSKKVGTPRCGVRVAEHSVRRRSRNARPCPSTPVRAHSHQNLTKKTVQFGQETVKFSCSIKTHSTKHSLGDDEANQDTKIPGNARRLFLLPGGEGQDEGGPHPWNQTVTKKLNFGQETVKKNGKIQLSVIFGNHW